MTYGTLKRKGAQFTQSNFSTAHRLLHCSAVIGLYTLLSALKREIGAFSGMVSGVSFSLLGLPELGNTWAALRGLSALLGTLGRRTLSMDEPWETEEKPGRNSGL